MISFLLEHFWLRLAEEDLAVYYSRSPLFPSSGSPSRVISLVSTRPTSKVLSTALASFDPRSCPLKEKLLFGKTFLVGS